MKYSLRATTDLQKIEALHMLTFPEDEWDSEGKHWIAHDEVGTPVAFCSAKLLPEHDCGYFTRAGVLPCAQGQGLQIRMIRRRHSWVKSQGLSASITYTIHENYPSIINLLKCGFQFYNPPNPWAGNQHYFIKRCK